MDKEGTPCCQLFSLRWAAHRVLCESSPTEAQGHRWPSLKEAVRLLLSSQVRAGCVAKKGQHKHPFPVNILMQTI